MMQTIRHLLIPALVAALTILNVRADYPSAVTNLNPVGYWRFNDSAGTSVLNTGTATNYSSLGAAADGTYFVTTNVGIAPSSVSGDTAPYFNALANALVTNFTLAEYVQMPNRPELLTNSAMSIEIWVLRTNLSGTSYALCGGMDTAAVSTEYKGFGLFLDNANSGTRNYFARIRHSTNGNDTVVNHVNYNFRLFGLAAGTPLGQWDHVVVTWSTTTIQGYINGVVLTSTSFPAGQQYHPDPNNKLRIGADSKQVPQNAAAKTWLAHAAIYPYVLTPTQVTNHMLAATSAATYKSTILGDNPVGYWPLNETGTMTPPTVTVMTITNSGTWGASANGQMLATEFEKLGMPGVPYAGFGGSTCATLGTLARVVVPPQSLVTNQFTVTAWVKLGGNNGSGNVFNAGNTQFGFRPTTDPGMVNNEVSVSVNGAPASITPKLYQPSNEWAFVAWVARTNYSTIYVNGYSVSNSLATSKVLVAGKNFGTTNMWIGESFIIGTTVSDVALFDHALTDVEVAQMYDASQASNSTSLQMSVPNGSGDFTVSGNTIRGGTAKLWKNTDLTAGWTQVGLTNSGSVSGFFSFPLNKGVNPQGFYKVE